MRRSHAVLAVFIAILLATLVRHRLRKQSESDGSNDTTQEAVQTQTMTPSPSTTPAHLASPSPGATPAGAVEDPQKGSGKLDFPTLKEVRDQVSQDPHHTPQALIQFAKDLSARAEVAKQSQGSAQEFFGVLEDCLASGKDPSESIPMPAQLTCLTTAEEFAKLYPNELGQRLKPLQQDASPELKRIRSALDRF